MSTHNICFLWRNKKNIYTFELKKKSILSKAIEYHKVLEVLGHLPYKRTGTSKTVHVAARLLGAEHEVHLRVDWLA